jgi:hypothetical protein
VNAELFLYALVATVSPTGFAATLAVIASGRAKALLFTLAFVFGQVAACASGSARRVAPAAPRAQLVPGFEEHSNWLSESG